MEVHRSGTNNPLWYIENAEIKEIKADKQPIGKTDNPVPFTTHKIFYNTGTIFYLMTDGYAGQFGGPKEKINKYKQLQEQINLIHAKNADEQKDKLSRSFENWKENLEQVDDVTIIGIRI